MFLAECPKNVGGDRSRTPRQTDRPQEFHPVPRIMVDNHASARGIMDMLRSEGPVCRLRADRPEGGTQGPKALTYP